MNASESGAGADAPAPSVPVEDWKYIDGYGDRYEVSSLGRVRSWVKWHRYGGLTDEPRIKKHQVDRKGYCRIKLSDGVNPERTHLVSSLVMAAFIGPRPKGTEVCHGDGDPRNNRLDNLRYDTPKANAADKLLHGTNNHGERHGISKLTESQVIEIFHSSEYQDVIARKYGISQSRVSAIKNGKTWSYLNLRKEM